MIKEIKHIPTLPQVTVELIQQAFKEEPDIHQMASMVEKDPTLTAKLFKLVNSAAFGLRVEVKSVSQAISLIGLETLRSTIISITMGQYFINNSFGNALNVKNFCSHSLATAVIMQKVAQHLEIKEADELYLIGLLHDLGKIALDTLPDWDYGNVIQLVEEEGKTFEEAERIIFGTDNHQIWDLMATTWNFPSSIIALNKGSVKGKKSIKTARLTEEASRMAEIMGYYLVKPPPKDTPAESGIIRSLDRKSLHSISDLVLKEVEFISKSLELPELDTEDVLCTFMGVLQQLSMTNLEYEKIHNELIFRVEVLQELTHVFTGIIKSLHDEGLAFSVLESMIEGFHADGAFQLNYDGEGQLMGYVARMGEREGAKFEEARLLMNQISPSMQKCLQNQTSIKVDQPQKEDVLKKILGNVQLAWLSPIYVRGCFTSILGLGVKNKGSRKFNSREFGKILDIISGEVGLSMENSRLFHRVQNEATTDSLTNINNRRTIMKVLTSEFARFKRNGTPLAVAIFDMDHFKTINDQRGHLAGDEFLKKIAQILKREIRESDYIGRFGGDEFIAVFPNTTTQEAQAYVERIREKLVKFCGSYNVPKMEAPLSVSVGLAGVDESMVRSDELIRHADNALYKAKDSGRNLCIVY